MDKYYNTELQINSVLFDDQFQYFQYRKQELEKEEIYENQQQRFKAPYEEKIHNYFNNNKTNQGK